jgi:ubiquinone/menaquinone biosynthesis C-methylase UbiE
MVEGFRFQNEYSIVTHPPANRITRTHPLSPGAMIPLVPQTLRLARQVTKGFARRLDRLAQTLNAFEQKVSANGAETAPESHAESVVRLMNQYNMVTHPDESYYADQYLRFIVPELERRFPERHTAILDLGCGQGRLSLPLARWCADGGGTVSGVDLTPAAVALARQYAAEQNLRNVTFVQGDAVKFVREAPDSSADAVLFTEVTFFMPSYRQVLEELSRLLKPGGVAFIGFRSQYYYLLQLAWLRSWANASQCLIERGGNIFGDQMWCGWHTVEDIRPLLAEVRLQVNRLYGVGVLSGTQGDARGAIVHPALLSREDQKGMMEVECAAAEQYAACGRYILAVAERLRA